MHPDHLPPPTALQRVVKVLNFPLLRLVWTLVLFFLLEGALIWRASAVAHLDNFTLGGALRNALLSGFVLWASLLLFEGKTLAASGLSFRGAPLLFAKGFLVGAALLTLVTLTLWVCGCYHVVGLGAGASLSAFGYAAALLLFVAVFEEVLFRGILFRLLEKGLGTWAALALSALFFGASHFANPGATILSVLALAVEAGALLAAAYVATRSLWVPIGLHTAWNFFEGPVYGARVSGLDVPSLLDAHFAGPHWLTGGTFGPEAGLAATLWGAALGAAFLVLAFRRGQFFTPRWLRALLAKPPRPSAPRAGLGPSGQVALPPP